EPSNDTVAPDSGASGENVNEAIGGTSVIVSDSLPLEPVFPAASLCVAESVYTPYAESCAGMVALQPPEEQFATPVSVAVPPTDQVTAGASPLAVPQAPPIDVTPWLVEYGKLTGAPLTRVKLTGGAVLSIVNDSL